MPDIIGQSLGRYHIVEQLGEGGMATVYKAYDTRLEADVAVKVIRTEDLPPKVLERALKRFEREAKALAKLTHANIVKVIDYGEHEGNPYLVMPYLSGGTLKHRLTGAPMPWQESIKILLPVARALDFAHRQGMVHRDVKPSNVLITDDGDPLLTDFGIAKIIDEDVTLDLTGTSATVGTPEYMAPEQVTSKTVDHRVDIYGLGVVFYEMITGRKLYTADTPMAVLFKHASEPLPRPTQYARNLPDRVEQILFKALAKKPEDRYSSMGEFANALESMLSVSIRPVKAQSHQQPATNQQRGTIKKEKITPFARSKQPATATTSRSPLSLWQIGLVIGIVIIGAGIATLLAFNNTNFAPTEISVANETRAATAAPTVTETRALDIGSTMVGKDGMILLYVPAGQYIMGSENGSPNEKHAHFIDLDAFWIDQTEVTTAMYAQCVKDKKCDPPDSIKSATHDNYYGNFAFRFYPVIYVSWNDAKQYCTWAGRRLPTEAEWEKAARGTDQRIYPWGDDIGNKPLNYNNLEGDTTRVGKYPDGASYYGAVDMAGNVWEWVADWYSATYYAGSPSSNPTGPEAGTYRVIKGGSWSGVLSDPNMIVQSSHRESRLPSSTDAAQGFRCAMEATP